MRTIFFELCAESIDACLAARAGGADRIELCSALSQGGLTPSHGLIRQAVRRANLPVHVLLRPRGGNFRYTEAELAVMRNDLHHIQELGAAGVVLGLLTPESTVDVPRTQEFVAQAGQLEVTFHRAFDRIARLDLALEDVIATGCRRLLTSGGRSDVVTGAASLRELVCQAAGRITIAAGGGLRLENARDVAEVTGATHFHGSLRPHEAPTEASGPPIVRPADIRALLECLSTAPSSSIP